MLLQHNIVIPEFIQNKIFDYVLPLQDKIDGGDVQKAKDKTSEDFKPLKDKPTAGRDRHLQDLGSNFNRKLLPFLATQFPGRDVTPSGNFMYPAEGGYMGWHTNSNTPYERVYIVFATENRKSFFRYKDATGKVVTLWEKRGLNVYRFTTPEDELFWHCVHASCTRVSFGFRII